MILIRELLDNPYHVTFFNNGWAAKFTTSKGIPYFIRFDPDHDLDIDFPENVEVSFFAQDKNRNTFLNIIDTGDAAKVFSTVIWSIREFLDKYHSSIWYILVSAKETSRVKLYQTLVETLTKKYRYKFVGKKNIGGLTYFIVDVKNR